MEPSAGQPAAADYRQVDRLLCDRCLSGGARGRSRQPHKHHHADLLFRPCRGHPRRKSHREDQGGGAQDLREERQRGHPAKLRRRRSGAFASPSCADPRRADERTGKPSHRPPRGARFREACDGGHDGRTGRRTAGQRPAGRRLLSDRYRGLGTPHPLPIRPGLGTRDLHPVWQLQSGLPAQCYPGQVLPGGAPRFCA